MIYIKGMKTLADIKIVKDELKKLKMKISFVGMGEVNIKGIFTSRLHDKLNKRLHKFDMSLLDTKEEKKLNSQEILVESICKVIFEIFNKYKEKPLYKYSVLISEQFNISYYLLNKIFKRIKGKTIQQYINTYRVNIAKQMILAGILNFSDIAFMLHYYNESHFARQFKEETGICPRDYDKNIHETLNN